MARCMIRGYPSVQFWLWKTNDQRKYERSGWHQHPWHFAFTFMCSNLTSVFMNSFWWVSLQVTWKGIRRNHESWPLGRQKESWSKKPLATAGGANVGFRPHGGRCAGAQEGTIYKDERSQPLGVSSGQPDGEPPGSGKKCPKYQSSWERKKI